jgi:hypothetical protein
MTNTVTKKTIFINTAYIGADDSSDASGKIKEWKNDNAAY